MGELIDSPFELTLPFVEEHLRRLPARFPDDRPSQAKLVCLESDMLDHGPTCDVIIADIIDVTYRQ